MTNQGMDARPSMTQFLFGVIRPTLQRMDMWSPSAEKLLLLIVAHESMGLRYRRQIGGPALSFFQIEPATFFDVCGRYVRKRPDRGKLIEAELRGAPLRSDFCAMSENDSFEDWFNGLTSHALLDALADQDHFSCAVARVRLAMVPEPLPDVADTSALAAYAKTYWNGPGKATVEEYQRDFQHYRPDARPVEWGPAE